MTDVIKGVLQPKTLKYKWKIERFFTDCKQFGDSYTSPVFSVQHPDKISKWYIRVYPKGLTEEDNNTVIIYLNLAIEDETEMIVDYQFFIVAGKNKLPTPGKVTRKFQGPSLGWGSNLIEQSLLRDARYEALTDDALEILCEISFHPIVQDVVESFYDKWMNKLANEFNSYEELFESENLSDVTFNVEGNKIHLHKAILLCRSPVFKTMFEHDMNENSVDITDVNYEVMKELFRFIYSGKVKNIEKIAKDLLIAADKYSIDVLKVLCEKTLYDNLKVDHVVEYLKLTDLCDTVYLKTLVVEFAAVNYKEIIKKPGFADLDSSVMYQILQAISKLD